MNILGARSLAGLSGQPQLKPRLRPRPRTARPVTPGRSAGARALQTAMASRAVATTWSAAPPRLERWAEGKVEKMLAVSGTDLEPEFSTAEVQDCSEELLCQQSYAV